MTRSVRSHPDLAGPFEPVAAERTPWLLCAFCLALSLVPPYVTARQLPNIVGSPARFIAVILTALAVLFFLVPKKKDGYRTGLYSGAAILVAYLSFMTIYWAHGLLIIGSETQNFFKQTVITSQVTAVGVGLYAVVRLVTPRDRSVVLGFMLTGITYAALIGLIQHTTKLDLADSLIPSGLDIVKSEGRDAPDWQPLRLGSFRAYGTYTDPLPFGTVCAASVPLAIHFAYHAGERWLRVLSGLAALILLAAVPASVARSSLIVLVFAMLLYGMTMPVRRIMVMAFGALGVYALIWFASPDTLRALSETITGSAYDPSVLVRLVQKDAMFAIFEQHPVFGLGMTAVTPAEYGPVDNYLALSLAEGGLMWVMSFLIICIGGIWGTVIGIRRSRSESERDQTLALGAFLLGVLVSTPTFASMSYEQVRFLVLLVFGVLWTGWIINPSRDPSRPGWVPSRVDDVPGSGSALPAAR